MVRPPYPAAVRLGLWWIANEADVAGRCALQGLCLEDEELVTALDVVYALIVSESPGVITGQEARHTVRARLDLALERPFDEAQGQAYDRAHWGTDAEAIAEAEKKDRLFGAVSYE